MAASENGTERLKVGSIASGGHFGMQAFESNPETGGPTVRNATVTVDSESCDLLVLSREKFFELQGQGGVLGDEVIKMMQEVELARVRANEKMLSERKGLQLKREGQLEGGDIVDAEVKKKKTVAVREDEHLQGVPPPPPPLMPPSSSSHRKEPGARKGDANAEALSPQETG